MKINIEQEQLNKGLGIVGGAIENKTIIPIMTNVYLNGTGNQLELRGANNETVIETVVECIVDEPGCVTLPYRLLSQLVAALSGEIELVLNPENQIVKWKCGNRNGSIHGLSGDEYPEFEFDNDGDNLVLSSVDFADMLEQASVAAGKNPGREWLESVHFSSTALQSGDGFRLAHRSFAGIPFEATVPARTISQVIRVSGDADQVGISQSGKSVLFDFGLTKIRANTLEVKYPDLIKAVPDEFSTVVHVDRKRLLRDLQLVQVYSGESSNRVMVTADSFGLRLYSNSPELGVYDSTVEAQVEGSPITMILNAKYLTDGVSAIKGDTLRIRLADEGLPIALDSEDDDYLYVQMPMYEK
ncbi:MAG: DNA polymerase III subunit beta [Candidatus Altiarchaeales archaeon]|nr:DNA polymerase III subunit beta [Candidatus Altiarchaeales archaeon]